MNDLITKESSNPKQKSSELNQNYIIAEIDITKKDINNKMRIINSFEQYLDEMIECCLDGLEVFYPDHSYDFEQLLLSKVNKYNLKASGGSDDHYTVREGPQYHMKSVAVPNIPETSWITDTLNEKKDVSSESKVMQDVIDELKTLSTQNTQKKL